MSQIVKEITKRVVKESTKKKPTMKPSGSQSQQSFAKQLFEPSREDEFKILSSSELLEALGMDTPDSALQKLKRGVTQLPRLSEQVDPIEALRTQFREGQSTDKRRRIRTPTSGTTEDSKRRDRTDEPIVPSIPTDPSLDIPTGEPPGRDEPPRPTIDFPWPRLIDRPESDDVYPTDTDDSSETPEDKPRLEKDVYECESAKEIAQLFGLPEPVCERHGAATISIRGRVI